MNNVKFVISEDDCRGYEYTANQVADNPYISKVSWVDDTGFHEVEYLTEHVEHYFNDGSWIKII